MSDPAGPEQQFNDFLAQGKLRLQRCRADGRFIFYPRVLCPRCGSTDLDWTDAPAIATVYSTTVVRRKAEAGGDYNLALIDLADGARMMSRVEGVAPESVKIGMAVQPRISSSGEKPLVIFAPLEATP